MPARRVVLLIAILLLALLHNCSADLPSPEPTLEGESEIVETQPTDSPSSTPAPTETATPAPSSTPIPLPATATAEPSATSSPEPTPTVTPSPSFPAGEIAYTSHEGSDGVLYLVDTAGSGRRRLVSGDGDLWNPAWSPDGSQLAFISRENSGSNLCLVSVGSGSSAPRCLTGASLENEHYPVWSPDGVEIAFYAGSGRTYEIWVLDVQSVLATEGEGDAWQLTLDLAADNSDAFDWSPDGAHLLLSSKHQGDREIYTADISAALEAQQPVEIASLEL